MPIALSIPRKIAELRPLPTVKRQPVFVPLRSAQKTNRYLYYSNLPSAVPGLPVDYGWHVPFEPLFFIPDSHNVPAASSISLFFNRRSET